MYSQHKTENYYSLLGAFKEDNVIIPVKIDINERVLSENEVHLSIALTPFDVGESFESVKSKKNDSRSQKTPVLSDLKSKIKVRPTSTAKLKIAEIIKNVNTKDIMLSELSEWDYDLLNLELDDIVNIDMEQFGFEFDLNDDEDDSYYGDERERTFNSTNLHDFKRERCAGKYEMPVLRACNHIPTDLISFNYKLVQRGKLRILF